MRLTDEVGALASPATGNHILRTLTDDPFRPHVTDGSPCWCGMTRLNPLQGQAEAAQSAPPYSQLDAIATEGGKATVNTYTVNEPSADTLAGARAESLQVEIDLATLAKVREAWTLYGELRERAPCDAPYVDPEAQLLILLRAALAP